MTLQVVANFLKHGSNCATSLFNRIKSYNSLARFQLTSPVLSLTSLCFPAPTSQSVSHLTYAQVTLSWCTPCLFLLPAAACALHPTWNATPACLSPNTHTTHTNIHTHTFPWQVPVWDRSPAQISTLLWIFSQVWQNPFFSLTVHPHIIWLIPGV